jgi:carbamoyl-phosphate synthase large subunit
LLGSGKISYVVATSTRGRNPAFDDVKLRRKACQLGIPCLTSLDTAGALADSLRSGYNESNTELVNINELRTERLKLPFIKMHGSGNDYVYIDCITDTVELNSPESLSVYLTDRNTGIGSDGVVLILPSAAADAKMRIFNRDGSEGLMCGNAIRCVAKYLYDQGIERKLRMSVETQSGIKQLELFTHNGWVSSVRVDMGAAVLHTECTVAAAGHTAACLSIGNPHAVIFVENVENADVETIGPLFEYHPSFPDRANVEFVEVMGRNHLEMRIWERGSGETRGCGSGASAAAAAAVLGGHCDKDTDIKVKMTAGAVTVRYTGDTVFLTGGCEKVFDGVVEI